MKLMFMVLLASSLFCSVQAFGAGLIQLPKTGQTTSYAAGDDGALEKGVAWPVPRFVDNGNGTVTDKLTGLVWLKNANCLGAQTWANALVSVSSLNSGACGLSDGSSAGDWRLPNVIELESLIDAERFNQALPAGHPYTFTCFGAYWSSSTSLDGTERAWYVQMDAGYLSSSSKSTNACVWPVRGGQ